VRTTASQWIETMKASSRKLGPYVLLELLLPGGTLFALALLLYRRPTAIRDWGSRVRAATLRAFGNLGRTRARDRRVVRMAECRRRSTRPRVAVPGRAAPCCATAPEVRTVSTHRNPIWRSRSFTAGGCPGS
jgi:hypothetical protein